jgi:hypothetical protein
VQLEIENTRWRANPNYDLIMVDELSDAERQQWQGVTRDADYCAILRSKQGPAQRIKLICKNTADLYNSLLDPRPLPAALKTELGDRYERTMAQLVADGILEIERDGCFVSGVEAYELIRSNGDSQTSGGRISRLSFEALGYAQALEIADSARLCARLYFYNRVPAAPDLARRLPDPEEVARFLGVSAAGTSQQLLERHWFQTRFSESNDGWLIWHNQKGGGTAAQSGTYKLYISSTLEALPEILPNIISVLTSQAAPVFKAGKDLPGLLRPDKLIAYFSSLDHLQETARRLAHELNGAPVHGVPFTAELACDGLLSWGIDPPVNPGSTAGDGQESWRVWLASRLAAALIAAKATKTDIEPWRFAIERVRLEGVDTGTWTPATSIWETGRALGKL